jgi:diguanylate cyclase (GGDEF)-like protein
MESWDEEFAKLRVSFVRESFRRLDDMSRLLELLGRIPSDVSLLDDLMRQFHGLAGAGRTYGFGEVTDLGLEGEKECAALVKATALPSQDQLDHWGGLMASLRRVFKEASSTTPETEGVRGAGVRPAADVCDILVVDQDQAVLGHLSRLLEQEGMSVRAATTRSEALRSATERMPSALIVDAILPDGSSIVEELRALPRGDEPPLLIMSSRSGFLDRVEAIHSGADGYFEKPVDWGALMRRLQYLLERDRGESARILSMEDDPAQSAFVRAILESAGYEVRICDDAIRFEADLVSFRPDLVLMDVLLPRVSGYDLARYMRQDEQYATVPILFLTTEGQVDARLEAVRAGGDDHLPKPVTPGLLLTAIAARIERARFVRSLLSHDGLTRLLNHAAFLERARAGLASARRRRERSIAWVLIDLDHFKAVNDRYGHPAGDRVLVSLSGVLRRRLRQSDTIGRYGGEEFAVLLGDLSEEQALRLVGRLLEEFSATDQRAPDGSTFRTDFSAGIAMLEPQRMDLESWRQAAEAALEMAKTTGRRRVVLSAPPSA